MISSPLAQAVQMGLEYSLVLRVDAGVGQQAKRGEQDMAWPMLAAPEPPMLARQVQEANFADTGDMTMVGMGRIGRCFRPHRLSVGQGQPDAQALFWCPCQHVSLFCPCPCV